MSTGYKNAAFTKNNVGVFSPDRGIVGDTELLRHVEAKIRIKATGDASQLLRYCMMGRIFGVSDEIPVAGNTGNTDFVVGVTGAFEVGVGQYRIRCTTAGNAAAARYKVYGPDGQERLPEFVQGAAKTGEGLSVNPTHRSANPAVGDTWTFRVSPVRWERVNPKSITGSAIVAGLLVQDVDAANGVDISGDTGYHEVNGHIYTQGVFDWNAVDMATSGRYEPEEDSTFDHNFVLEDLEQFLANTGLIVRDSAQHRNDALETSSDRADWL